MKDLKEYININEGLVDLIKITKQFTKLQADVTAKYEEEKNKFKIKQYAEESYKKYVTNEKAISFDEWWEGFYNALVKYNS